MLKVRKRGGFSDRNNIKPENMELQINDFDERTRVRLNNIISELYVDTYKQSIYQTRKGVQDFLRYVLGEVYLETVDAKETIYESNVFEEIKQTIIKDDYDSVLTLIEAVVDYWNTDLVEIDYNYKKGDLFRKINDIFEEEFVGYRFIDGQISPISDEIEMNAIEEALCNEYSTVVEHLSKALKLLSDRVEPDFENSIKESISAVEAMCKIITDSKGGNSTLGKTLKKLKTNDVYIHSALEDAFEKLYGYTSDANGVRHAGDIGGANSTFEEAKYMLVSCCAFVNYLKGVIAD